MMTTGLAPRAQGAATSKPPALLASVVVVE